MPAAAVIPAPIAYIKVVAVKKLVVGSGLRRGGPAHVGTFFFWSTCRFCLRCLLSGVVDGRNVYFEKIRVLKAGVLALYNVAWNNGIGSRFYFAGFLSSR